MVDSSVEFGEQELAKAERDYKIEYPWKSGNYTINELNFWFDTLGISDLSPDRDEFDRLKREVAKFRDVLREIRDIVGDEVEKNEYLSTNTFGDISSSLYESLHTISSLVGEQLLASGMLDLAQGDDPVFYDFPNTKDDLA